MPQAETHDADAIVGCDNAASHLAKCRDQSDFTHLDVEGHLINPGWYIALDIHRDFDNHLVEVILAGSVLWRRDDNSYFWRITSGTDTSHWLRVSAGAAK